MSDRPIIFSAPMSGGGAAVMSVQIEQLDLFGLGRMWWQGQPGRECLTDHARFDAGDRREAAIELGAPGCRYSRLVIDVAQDAAGRWWSGYSWGCHYVPDGRTCGTGTPIDTHRAETREEAIRLAAASCARSLPEITTGKAGRILNAWRRELAKEAGDE